MPLFLKDFVARNNGLVPLAPTYVHRFYSDLNRLNQKKLKKSATQFIPERRIGSSVQAGSEFFLPIQTARQGVQIQSSPDDTLELFTFFPGQ